MRTAFLEKLLELARRDERVCLITGDLGFGVLDQLASELPNQFLNAGVAEQNMTAVATGMALEGRKVFTYSIGNFPTLRCLEHLRNDTFYHRANVNVVSVGGGFSYGQLGMSHHATEDLSIMRSLPEVKVFAPGSRFETSELTEHIIFRNEGPTYLRLERSAPGFEDNPDVPIEFGKARTHREGESCTIIAIGGVVAEAVAAADALAADGISCRVLSMHTLKPIDEEAIFCAVAETDALITVEENTVVGGLGGAVAEVCMNQGGFPRRFRMLGIKDRFTSEVGDQDFLRKVAGIDAESIAMSVRTLLN